MCIQRTKTLCRQENKNLKLVHAAMSVSGNALGIVEASRSVSVLNAILYRGRIGWKNNPY